MVILTALRHFCLTWTGLYTLSRTDTKIMSGRQLCYRGCTSQALSRYKILLLQAEKTYLSSCTKSLRCQKTSVNQYGGLSLRKQTRASRYLCSLMFPPYLDWLHACYWTVLCVNKQVVHQSTETHSHHYSTVTCRGCVWVDITSTQMRTGISSEVAGKNT